ncbi:DUF222 domain-containing protein [Glutamicibacter endophyticus]|uniref:HNH endonuclease signature motif containing protein n=1 Tax=Glutamicibacter endophyticus TaxID=1522174 RepID=UPI003AF1741B
MSKREVFHSDDDPHRLHITPPGSREYTARDGTWSAEIESDRVFGTLLDTATKLRDMGAPTTAAEGLSRLETIGRLRSMIDAAEAMLLSDSFELSIREAEVQRTDPLIPDELLREKSAECYGVNPSEEPTIRSSFVAEAAGALRVSERSMQTKLMTAEGLRSLCPDTFNALARAAITGKSAQEIVRHAQDLLPEDVEQMEKVLLPIAHTASDQTVSNRARKMRDRLHPQPVEERHEQVREARSVVWWPEDDGMAVLRAYMPAEDVLAIVNTINWHAGAHRDPDDQRSDQQLRVDILRDALLDGWPERAGTPLKPRVAITIPAVEMLADPKRTLADLEGYGPIPLGAALKLTEQAPSFLKVLTDPWTGAVIDVGRTRYRPPQALRDLVRYRDQTCQFPGCNRLPERSEIDHIDDWAKGGGTTRKNCRLLCKQHQMFKHALGWQVVYLPDGSAEWRSPHEVVMFEVPGSITTPQVFGQRDEPPAMLPVVKLDGRTRQALGWHDGEAREAG